MLPAQKPNEVGGEQGTGGGCLVGEGPRTPGNENQI